MLFAAHESFHIREGWLRKGLLGIQKDPLLFSQEFAVDMLGVGHNMVSAIRYWLQATGLAQSHPVVIDGKRIAHFEWTPLAHLIMGYDPFFEDEGTLWILHAQLATNVKQATTWHWFFNRFGLRQFTQDLFLTHLQRYVAAEGRRKISVRSLERDFRCFIRTYARSEERVARVNPEDSFDCPLSILNILEVLPLTKSFRLVPPTPEGLDPLFVAYALIRLKAQRATKEVSFRDALYSEGSPGRIYGLDAEALHTYFTRLENQEQKLLSFSRTAGLNVVTLQTTDPESVLRRYYDMKERSS